MIRRAAGKVLGGAVLALAFLLTPTLTKAQSKPATLRPANTSLKSYDQLIHLNFGDINKQLVPMAQTALDQALKQKCYTGSKKVGPYSPEFKTTYQCGEVPYGKIVGSSKKVFSLQMPKGKQLVRLTKNLQVAKPNESSVGAVTLRDAFKLDILLDRKQYTARVNENLLDTKGSGGLDVRSTLGDTVTIRHTPKGGVLYSLVCGYMPGIRVSSNTTSINLDAKYTWRFLFFSATERMSVLNTIRDGHSP